MTHPSDSSNGGPSRTAGRAHPTAPFSGFARCCSPTIGAWPITPVADDAAGALLQIGRGPLRGTCRSPHRPPPNRLADQSRPAPQWVSTSNGRSSAAQRWRSSSICSCRWRHRGCCRASSTPALNSGRIRASSWSLVFRRGDHQDSRRCAPDHHDRRRHRHRPPLRGGRRDRSGDCECGARGIGALLPRRGDAVGPIVRRSDDGASSPSSHSAE